MIRFEKLTMENFGLFAGEQTITFPEGDGVTVVYGENSKGKTTLLNAFRFAFTGQVLDRAGVRPPEALLNREVAHTTPGAVARVRLEFSADDHKYELTRAVVAAASGNADVQMILVRDGVALSQVAALREISEVMPPEVQQFFFFDGELLGQYEALMYQETASQDKLKASIEQLLGVPIVINAAKDCGEFAMSKGNELVTAAKRNRDLELIGAHLEQAQASAKRHGENVAAEQEKIAQIEAELDGIRETLAAQQRKTEVLADLKSTRLQIIRGELAVEESKAALAAALQQGMEAMLVTSLRGPIAELEGAEVVLQSRRNEAVVASRLSVQLAEHPDDCPTCGSGLDDDQKHQLADLAASHEDPETIDAELTKLRRSLSTLRELPKPDARVRLVELEKTYRKAARDLSDLRSKAQALEEDLQDVDQEDLQRLLNRSTQLAKQLQQHIDLLRAEEEKFNEQQGSAASLREKISRSPGIDVDPSVKEAAELATALQHLFTASVVAYRDTLRDSVQEAASRLFVQMRSEPEFARLTINEQYGLTILNDQGVKVADRSAGYEHLVALSLIGGLQECSTISGPVVMDSPFGRLDPTHTEKVLSNIHQLSGQVILLVHEGEVSPADAQRLLGPRMQVEYELKRVSSQHTEIKERRSTDD